METKHTSSCTDSKEMEMQRFQKKASIMKGSCINGLRALKSNFMCLSWKYVPGVTASEFERAFSRIFGEDVDTFTKMFSQNMDTLETKLTKETLHESNCQTAFRVLKTPFEKIFTSMLIKSSNLDDIRPSYDTEPMAEVPYTAEYNVFVVETQHSEQPENMNDTSLMEKVDSNTTPNSSDMCNDEFEDDQNADDHEDERVVLVNLIANLKLDNDKNKTIQKLLRKANDALTHELNEGKYALEVSNDIQDRCTSALLHKEVKLEKCIMYKNCQLEKEEIERKYKVTLDLLAQQTYQSHEALKTQAYETFQFKEMNAALIYQRSLESIRYDLLRKEKEQVQKDFKISQDKDIDKIIALENQVKFLNDVVYKLINLLMPLAEKTRANASEFEKVLKEEMFDDLQYVQSLEKELDELQSDKNDFSNEYDLLLKECLSKHIMCAILCSLADIDEQTKMQCLYLEKIKECKCLANELSKQTEIVGKQDYNELLKSFSKLEQHLISLKLALQQCQEQLKNEKVLKQQESSSFRDQNEQYFVIQDLKAQLQDKNIAISELNKLNEKIKGKGVDTNFGKPLILGKPPSQPIINQLIVRQPTTIKFERSLFSKNWFASQVVEKNDFTKPFTPHSWPQARQSAFAKPYHVNAPGPLRSSSKRVSFQSPKESVDKALNSKPSVITPDRLPNTANGSKPKLRNYNQQTRNCPPSMSSQVNSRTSAQKKDAQSHKTTKIYILIEKKNSSKNHGRQIPIGHKFSPNKSSAIYVKATPPRSGLTWKPTGKIFTYVGLKWIPTRNTVETCINTNDSASPLGKETYTPNIVICANSSSLSAEARYSMLLVLKIQICFKGFVCIAWKSYCDYKIRFVVSMKTLVAEVIGKLSDRQEDYSGLMLMILYVSHGFLSLRWFLNGSESMVCEKEAAS
ncbi:hypothetical protein Tco_0336096 [Tanacetum coccineum]